ncbi:potassium channel family protein [Blastococcus xanthinilyticus]|uniref:Ion channel n=1 Tax=Blastococcus xanthinilyticus TaxID=1564164 RepID=A0A5S5D4D9_9ACTN|nr:potassium channel family protein [Blastococcus xanthinilyticus]TYP90294.1 hypothetical protein BD833_10112 [Blastococcus xanthinilyticus]
MSSAVAALCIVLGAAVVVLVAWDVVSTTLTLGEGAGPLTRRVLSSGWRQLMRLHRGRADGRASLLTAGGPVLMVTTVVLWVGAFWTGWSLVFVGSGSVVEFSSGRSASVADVFYYAGFAVSSLGVGDFVSTVPGWRVATAVASFSGLALLTLSITYLFSVMSAVVTRRALATQLHALGGSAQDLLLGSWDGDRFDPVLTQQLLALPGQLATVAEQHLAYPVLHFFRSRRAEAEAPLAIARLDDAALLLRFAVAEHVRPPGPAVDQVRRVVDRYLATATAGHDGPAEEEEPPPPPEVGRLAAAGMPLADAGSWRCAVEEAAPRRVRLRRLVEDAGWDWEA